LCIRVGGPVNVEDKYFICLDKDSEVEKTDEDCTRSHKDVREEGRVYFTEIAREQAILGNKLTLLIFAVNKRYVSISIKLCAP
jgi:hypothetical protein